MLSNQINQLHQDNSQGGHIRILGVRILQPSLLTTLITELRFF